jgi:hypothetical protein
MVAKEQTTENEEKTENERGDKKTRKCRVEGSKGEDQGIGEGDDGECTV